MFRVIGRDVFELLEIEGQQNVTINRTLPLRRQIEAFRILAIHEQEGLDCGRTDCKHYGGLGCHGADDPMNQTACKLNLKQGMECLISKGTLFYETFKVINYRELLKKYIEVVAKNVCCAFVSNVEFSNEESEELGKLAEE